MIVHVTLAGLTISGVNYISLAEQPRHQAPFVAYAPWSVGCVCSYAAYEDWFIYPPSYVSWWVGTAHIDPSQAVTFSIKPGTVLSRLRVMRFEGEWHEWQGFVFDPCDIDMDGHANINDLMIFASQPYDWNGDGVLDAADYLQLMQRCT